MAAQLGTAQVLQIAEELGLEQLDKALRPMVLVAKLSNPSASDTDIENSVSGSLKHTMRGKVGFAVDFIWPFIEPYVKNEVAKTLSELAAPPAVPATS